MMHVLGGLGLHTRKHLKPGVAENNALERGGDGVFCRRYLYRWVGVYSGGDIGAC